MIDDLTPPHWGSDDLIPASDASLAVALAYQRAAYAVSESAEWPEDENGHTMYPALFARVVKAILALADQDALAEVQALTAERDQLRERVRALSFMGEGYAFVERRAEAAKAEVARLRADAGSQEKLRHDAFARRILNAPEDPHIAALCERYGYGAVMDAASRLWARKDSMGAFYIGGCIGIKSNEEAHAALTPKGDEQ